MILTARSPFASATKRTVTRQSIFGFPLISVAGVMAKVRIVESLPITVRVTVILVSLNAVMVPAIN